MSDVRLLDMHVLLWAVGAPHRLAAGVRSLIESRQYAASVASLGELINKKGKRDTPVNDPVARWNEYLVRPQTRVLPIRAAHVLYISTACPGATGIPMTASSSPNRRSKGWFW